MNTRNPLGAPDFSKLRGRIREKFGKQAAFARAIGRGPAAVSLKLTGKRSWTREEIEVSCSVLDIPLSEVHIYFFNVKFQD